MIRSKLFLCLIAALAACAKPTPYQPRAATGGFEESRLETDRYRVSFRGNTVTSRDLVERSLLYRAAELTLAEGGDWFEVVSSDTDVDRDYFTSGFIHPQPSLFRHRRKGFGAFPVFPPTIHKRERFEAVAEIVVRKGEKPGDQAEAYDARDVIATIGPSLPRPEVE
ncbi:MAG: hypothetical protein AAFU55_03620 [Pseudomonadota bacterium]